MMLGTMIAQLEDETVAQEALLATGDIALIARVQRAADAAGSPVGGLLQELIGRFNAHAASDDWIAVMNAAGRAEMPGAACLRIMLGVALASQDKEFATRPSPT